MVCYLGLVISRSVVLALLVLLAACGGEEAPTSFTLTFENISSPGQLSTSDGGSVDVVFAAGVWAELDPGVLFTTGDAASTELEEIAEDGENLPLLVEVEDWPNQVTSGTLADVDVSTYTESPLAPGVTVEVQIDAVPGDDVSFVSMFIQSNDAFVGPRGGSLQLFDDMGQPLTGDRTADLALFDAGTEMNEEPGLGPNQPLRQAAHGDGMVEGGVVTIIDGMDAAGYTYPAIADVFRLSVSVAGE